MKFFYSLIITCLSLLGYSQTILYQSESTSRTVQDPQTVILAQGFHASSTTSNPFVAKIGPSADNPGGGPIDSGAGASNPSGTTTPSGQSFHDTKGNIEVNGAGQLQFTLPIALPPGVKSVAPQVNLVYTSSSGNGIAGYGWNLSGITSISRSGKTIEKDGEIKGIQSDYSDYYSFNGQRLILKSGEYGQDGAEYVTEKYSNVKIKSVGSLQGFPPQNINGPQFWEVTFEDGSQAWYGATDSNVEVSNGRTSLEYNIIKWRDNQGNYITYIYSQKNNVSFISAIQWGGNETLHKPHFNTIEFTYIDRYLKEQSYVQGIEFNQDKLLSEIKVSSSGNQFKKYGIHYSRDTNGTQYQFADRITEYNAKDEAANPVAIAYEESTRATDFVESKSYSLESGLLGDFDGDGKIDALEFRDQPFRDCESFTPGFNGGTCINPTTKPAGLYIIKKALDQVQGELMYVGAIDVTKEEFKKALPLSFKNLSGIVENKQGFTFYKLVGNATSGKKDIHLMVYSISEAGQLEHQYTKILPNPVYDYTTPQLGPFEEGYSIKTSPSKLMEMDLDGDGISELLMGFDDAEHTKIKKPEDPNFPISLPEFQETFSNRKRYIVINMDHAVGTSQSYSHMSFYPYDTDILEIYKAGDFDGDGKTDFLRFDSGNRPFIIRFNKGTDHLYSAIEQGFYLNDNRIKGISKNAVVGDFNGDGKSDLLVPSATTTSDWYLYQSTGKSFEEDFKPNFALFRRDPYFKSNDDGTATLERTSHQAYDIDRDGKSDFVTFNYRKERVKHPVSNNFFYIYYYNVVDIKISSGGKIFNNDIRYAFNEGPLLDNSGFRNNFTYFNERTKYDFQELLGSFRINQSVHQIILVSPHADRKSPGDRVKKLTFYDLSKEARINAILQGGTITDVEYKELDPAIDPNFYQPVKKEQYPYIELNKVYQTFTVSQLRNSGRKQDFRYRGLISHFRGKGMIGFRQTARSSWYANGFENTKIWSGAEIDPINEGVPIKEWSIRTNSENLIFPTDISENNTQLLSFSATTYQTDKLLNGQVVTTISDADRPKVVTAMVPKSTKRKDFLTGTLTTGNIVYGNYYLPAQTLSNVNNGYAVTTSDFEYLHNLSGTGSDYFVGRPKSKVDKVQAYGDTKSAKEEYIYENNQLKTLKTWNRDNTGSLQETYTYDGFGNIIEKITGNSIDAQTQTTKATYDLKGRFVIKKTDQLGLETSITYNDWGQLLTQTDPLGNMLINTYDNWGKVLKSKTNLGGTTTYQYEKDNQFNIIATQYDSDGDVTKSYTNKLGQNYKSSTKAFNQGQFVAKEIRYDLLGRKTQESEPYFDGGTISQWNVIAYNDTFYPAKITATALATLNSAGEISSFLGKQVETSVSGNTTTVREVNGYARTNTKTTDALGNVVSTTDKGGTILFSYNAAGEQIKAQYAENIVTTKYDVWGRKSEFNDPSNGLYRYEYDGFGQPTKTISPKGTKEYTYNNTGQLTSQKETSTTDGGQATKKEISYLYDNKGRIISKSGTSKGQAYSSNISYDPQGRLLSSSQSSNGKYFIRKGITYDDKARVISYDKQLYSSGLLTKVTVENIYSSWNGELFQVKDKVTGKSLWELKEANAKGQVLQAKLGAANVTNGYDGSGFLTTVNHSSQLKPGILQLTYAFDGIKNELKSRTTGGDFNIIETFDYDDNNRLVNWTNPVTGVKVANATRNVYDAKGRILENDQVGKIKFENSTKIYQPTGMTLNAAGEQNYNNDLIQSIAYNENNDPVFIDGQKGDVAFRYGLTSMRQKVSYGGNFDPDQEGKFTKFYSEDGSFEVVKNNTTGKEKHIMYIGGSPYESNIVYLKDFAESSGSFKFLHKDYIGSILAISDEAGNKLEQRHFDAWGNFTHLQIGNGAIITNNQQLLTSNLLIDRGYTSHEHFLEVGIIHMNGRLYDPLLRRFLNADENIQDPTNTQNYNKYGYVMNNPLMYNDPSGEFVFVAGFFLTWVAPIIWAAIVGTAISVGIYAVQATINNNWSWNGFGRSVLMGAVTGAVSGGAGLIFSAGGFWGTVATGAISGAGSGGAVSLINGTNFLEGLTKGAVIGGAVAGISWGINKFNSYVYQGKTLDVLDIESEKIYGTPVEHSSEQVLKVIDKEFNGTMPTNGSVLALHDASDLPQYMKQNGYTFDGSVLRNRDKLEVLATTTPFYNNKYMRYVFAPNVSRSYEQLVKTTGHELLHGIFDSKNISSFDMIIQTWGMKAYPDELTNHHAIIGVWEDKFLNYKGWQNLPVSKLPQIDLSRLMPASPGHIFQKDLMLKIMSNFFNKSK